MVTDKMMEAIEMMVEMCNNEEQKRGMESVRKMLADFVEEVWIGDKSLECNEWLKQYLHEQVQEEKPWYTERWYDTDLEVALEEEGISVTEENVQIFKISCSKIFDDKSDRNEMLKSCAWEIFKRNTVMHN